MIYHSINLKKNLPENVFEGKWSTFLLFDSDWIFSSEFIDFCHDVMKREPKFEVEIIDLDDPKSFFRVNAEKTWEDYRHFLNGQDFEGWLHDVHRFSVSTASQSWCIYLERDAEIAIFSAKASCAIETLSFIKKVFKALPVREMVASENITVFQRELVSCEFAQMLVLNYC